MPRPSSRVHRTELKLMCEGLNALLREIPMVGGPDYPAQMDRSNRLHHLKQKLDCDRWLGQEVGEPPTRREVVTQKPLTDIEGLPPAKKD